MLNKKYDLANDSLLKVNDIELYVIDTKFNNLDESHLSFLSLFKLGIADAFDSYSFFFYCFSFNLL